MNKMKTLYIYNLKNGDIDSPKYIKLEEGGLIYLINNGLDKGMTKIIRNIMDSSRIGRHNYQLFEYNNAVPSGKVLLESLTAAMNNENVDAICYQEGNEFVDFEFNLDYLATKPCLAIGNSKSSNEVYDFSRTTEFQGKILRSAFILLPPFTLNLDLLRQGMKNTLAFRLVQEGFTNAFPSKKDVDFPVFFNMLYRAFEPIMTPHIPLVSLQ